MASSDSSVRDGSGLDFHNMLRWCPQFEQNGMEKLGLCQLSLGQLHRIVSICVAVSSL